MLEVLPLVFFIGVVNRIADMIADDGLKLNRYLGYSLGITYGIIIAYVLTHYAVLAPLGLAIILSVMFTGKIDHKVHYFGIGTFILFMALWGIGAVDPVLIAVFVAAGLLDEIGNDHADRNGKGLFSRFFMLRLTMEMFALLVSAYTGQWIILVSIFFYDLGFTYIFPRRVRKKLLEIAG